MSDEAKDVMMSDYMTAMPYMHANGQSTIRNVVESVMLTLGLNNHDFRLRDEAIAAGANWIDEEAKSRHAELTTANAALRAEVERLRGDAAKLKDENDEFKRRLDGDGGKTRTVDAVEWYAVAQYHHRKWIKDHAELTTLRTRVDKNREVMEGWKGLATYYAESLKQAAVMCSKLESLTDGTPDDENFARVVAEVNESLHHVSTHVAGTDIGAHMDYGAWMTKDGWSDEPPMGYVGEPKMRLLTLSALAAQTESSDEQIKRDLADAGIDMTEPNKRLREMVNKAKETK